MATLLYTHEACLAHDTGPYHPERPDRLRAVLEALDAPAFAGLVRREAPEASEAQLLRAHPRAHIDRVKAAIPAEGLGGIDADTLVSPHSLAAALRAAGAVCAAVDAVVGGEAQNAFCAVRPPGHHAESARAMGFCLFNSAAVGAYHARAAHGLKRVAVVDFDVHHGNGTQDIFWNDHEMFYASTHQAPLYPGTGAANERGLDNILNVPLPPLAGSEAFRHAFAEHVLPALTEFRPDLVIISAGFDAHRDDPLAALCLEEEDFAWATRELMRLAAYQCGGRLVSTLEGGYDLDALGRSAAAHVAALMGQS